MPLHLKTLQLHKTARMLQVDDNIFDYSHSQLEHLEGRRSVYDQSTTLLFEINRICDRIRYLEECIHKHDSEDLDFVCETGFHEEASALGSLFSRQERKFEALLDHCIDALRVDSTGIILIETSGGEGHRYWSSRVRSMNGKGAQFHARLYTKRCTIRHNDLTKWGSELEQYRRRLKERVSAQSLFGPLVSLEDNALHLQQRELMATHTRYLDMKSFASQPTLDLRLFAAVANARIYERNTQPQECVQRAVAFFSTYTPASRAQ
ncbi:hypothetical protein BGZ67_002489 [Mortierella alpina]|nr:hypothetical protein BGZ67_002489 [Mortierella alpina]